MKSRIGKLEGDLRTNKKLRESMDKHIRMLENALRKRNQEKSHVTQLADEKEKGSADVEGNVKSSPSITGKFLKMSIFSRGLIDLSNLKRHRRNLTTHFWR